MMLFLNNGSRILHNFTDYPAGIKPTPDAITKCSGCGVQVEKPIRVIYDRFKLMTNNPRIEVCHSDFNSSGLI